MTHQVAVEPAADSLRRLIEAACETLDGVSHPLVKVAAAVLAEDGRIFRGVQVRSRNCGHCATCAEIVALGAALTAGATAIRACVAVVRDQRSSTVYSPCGTCREALRDFGVAEVIVSVAENGAPVTVTPGQLLPWP